MPKIVFTANIQRLVECRDCVVSGQNAGAALDDFFRANPRARGYILDDQGALRKHIAVFIDRSLIRDRVKLSDPVREDATIYVMQALSGG